MDKPISMSVKDYLIRILAVKTLTSEKAIEAIINHQFQSANEALRTNNSVEISGFGKFIYNVKKAQKKMEVIAKRKEIEEAILMDENSSEQKKKKARAVINDAEVAINLIKVKLNNNEN
jgi:nucleoid DNA-binding protein